MFVLQMTNNQELKTAEISQQLGGAHTMEKLGKPLI